MQTRTKGIIALALVAAFFGLIAYMIIQGSRREYLDFSARRSAWSERCEPVRTAGRAANPAAYDACARELDALVAEAKAKGWAK